jgi:TPR repeat protein
MLLSKAFQTLHECHSVTTDSVALTVEADRLFGLQRRLTKATLVILLTLVSAPTFPESCTTGVLVSLKEISACADQGSRVAQNMLGQIYFHGREVPTNYKLAFDWTLRSANQGDKDAQAHLGFHYFNGWGVPKDLVLATVW